LPTSTLFSTRLETFHRDPAQIAAALQEREFERLGSNRTRRWMCDWWRQPIAISKNDGESRVPQRLVLSLNVFHPIPPLRERPDDIPCWSATSHKYGRRMQKQIESIPAAALRKLSSCIGGNIRELEIHRAFSDPYPGYDAAVPMPNSATTEERSGSGTRQANERDEIVRILKVTNGE